MAARPAWRGQIKLALVSIPVEIYPATKSGAAIAFHQIHEPSGKRIKYEKVVPGIGPVNTDDIVKGFEVTKGEYVLLEPEEIESVKLESRKTLDLVQFVDMAEVDAIYYDKPYFVVPADDLAEEAYIVVRDALRAARKIGIGQLAMRGQEYVVALKPCGRGMLLETLRYSDEVNKAASYFREIEDAEPDADLLDLAGTLIEKKSGKFEPQEFHNRYVDALKGLIEEKRKSKGELVIQDPGDDKPAKSNVIDLMAALKKSLGDDAGNDNNGTAAKPAAKRPAARKPAAAKKADATAKKTAAAGRKR
ncbi:Ku protein [Sphingomonas sp. BN140010]|uniref:Non-homologous end joining protein Ku n=1 Tax=Sphingomonas arvum TaxID=2992113 RepID=A0ABT3JGI6_9SPHN|nr:Ku protein [Sphingomonas sp. BN140010]MCW3798201.1 Ku protein [Sphingomonas sp. BN140010]